MKEPVKRVYTRTALFMAHLIMDDDSLINNPMFVGMYNKSLDYPWLNEHLFILYRCIELKQSIWLEKKLEKNENFYNQYSIRIGGVWYELAIFRLHNGTNLSRKGYQNSTKLNDFKLISDIGKVLYLDHYRQIIKLWKSNKCVNIEDFIFDKEYFGKIEDIVPLKDAEDKAEFVEAFATSE